MMKLNINELCKVKLTEDGKKVLEKYCKRYLGATSYTETLLNIANNDECYKDTLWDLCNIFGLYMMRDSNIKVFENDAIICEDFDLKNTDLIKFIITDMGKSIIKSHHPELNENEFQEFFNILTDNNGYMNMRLYDFALYFKDNFYNGAEPVIKHNSILVDKQVEIRVGDMVELTGWMNTRYNGLIAEVIGTGKSWGGMKTCKVKVKNTEGKFIEESVTIDMVKKVK